jgi:hypothetical protein
MVVEAVENNREETSYQLNKQRLSRPYKPSIGVRSMEKQEKAHDLFRVGAALPEPGAEAKIAATNRKQNIFMIFITLTQLVQMVPFGVGINSGLAIGEALGATRLQSVWVIASYPLTQGSVVLIGMFIRQQSPIKIPSTAEG